MTNDKRLDFPEVSRATQSTPYYSDYCIASQIFTNNYYLGQLS